MKFSAMLLLRQIQPITVSQIRSELRASHLKQNSVIGLVLLNSMRILGTSTIAIDDEPMSIVFVPTPAEVTIVEREHFANHIWPNVEADVAEHTAHLLIAATRDTVDQRALLKQARAVTLLAAVIARLAPFIRVNA